jgi:hypothetical protein
METPKYVEPQELSQLTQDEQVLHHYAAMVKKDLEAYHAYSRSKEDWKHLFVHRLARSVLTVHFYYEPL